MASGAIHYHNRRLGKTEGITVILPEASAGPGPFPTLYLLHGIGDDESDWLRRTRLEPMVERRPIIVVMPTTPWRSMYVDAPDGPAAATAIAVDLVDFVDGRFHTRRDAAGRAVCGLSMGGYGALHLALAFPERFGAAASHSGVLRFGHRTADRGGRPGLLRPATLRVAGPAPSGGPADLFAQAAARDPGQRPALRFDCGEEDGLIEDNRAFHEHLGALGYPHEYAEHPGGHSWAYWDAHVMESVDFFARTLGWPMQAAEDA